METEDGALEELHKELTCPVCLDLFREPVILECGHHFCRACIGRCWEAKSVDESTCPQCRKTCSKTPRPNSLLCNVVDSVRRARAMDARPKDPQQAPRSPSPEPNTSSCSRDDPEPRSEPGMCLEHEERLKLFCEDDQVAICLVCGMSRDHKTHNVIPINEAFENYKVRGRYRYKYSSTINPASTYRMHVNNFMKTARKLTFNHWPVGIWTRPSYSGERFYVGRGMKYRRGDYTHWRLAYNTDSHQGRFQTHQHNQVFSRDVSLSEREWRNLVCA